MMKMRFPLVHFIEPIFNLIYWFSNNSVVRQAQTSVFEAQWRKRTYAGFEAISIPRHHIESFS